MNKKHEMLKVAAKSAIQSLNGDTSVGNLVTRDDLLELREYIDELVNLIDDA